MTENGPSVLLYDGECGLCNGIVRFLLRHDPHGRLHYAPLQGVPAQRLLQERGLPTSDFSTLVFVPDWNKRRTGPLLLRTDGAFAACAVIGGSLRPVAWLRVAPRALRDAVYRAVARLRYRIFGKYRPRPLEDPSWQARFLTDEGADGVPSARSAP